MYMCIVLYMIRYLFVFFCLYLTLDMRGEYLANMQRTVYKGLKASYKMTSKICQSLLLHYIHLKMEFTQIQIFRL